MNNWTVFPFQYELSSASSNHPGEQMISHTDHNNKASLLYAPSNDAQGQWIERMTSYNEDNYAVSHQYEFSCEYEEQMNIRMTLYIVDNHAVLFLQCESSYAF